MTSSVVTIHHFDDEPEKIESLRDNLIALLILRRPTWIQDDEYPEVVDDPEMPWRVIVHRPEGVLTILYQIYRTTERFRKECKPKLDDIVILDAFEYIGEETKFVAFNCASLEGVASLAGLGRVFVASAYLATLPSELKALIPIENLIPRPFNLNEVTTRLLTLIGIPLGD